MFTRIMVPVDLRHVDELGKSLKVASDLSKHYQVPVCYVGVTESQPSTIAKNIEEFTQKLEAFAGEQTAELGHVCEARAFTANDLRTETDDVLLRAVGEVEADLVVMASHVPSLVDYIWPSNGGKIAAHSDAAVFVVR